MNPARTASLEAALHHRRAGRYAEAEAICREILAVRADDADVLHILALTVFQGGRRGVALVLADRAVRLSPDNFAFHNTLGLIHAAAGGFAAAIACYDRVLVLAPDCVEAMMNQANALRAQGRYGEARRRFGQALGFRPGAADLHVNLGNLFHDQRAFDEARRVFERAVVLDPQLPEGHHNLGTALHQLGEREQAVASFRRAIRLRPGYHDALLNLGVVLSELGKAEEAIPAYGQALAVMPDSAAALQDLGGALLDQGRLEEATVQFRRACAVRPDFGMARSSLLFCLNYHPEKSGEEIFEEYRRVMGVVEAAEAQPHPLPLPGLDPGISGEGDCRLRVGYVSPDFCRHPARHFVEPLLAHHDRTGFEVFAYAQVLREDAMTARFKGLVDGWRDTVGLTDEALAAQIRQDRIDILVDLAGHTRGSRVLAFALKPAPIRVSWLGYGYTTGLAAMDYFLSDPVFAPPGCDNLFVEKLVRLPVFAAYRPAEGMGEEGPLPARANGFVTFGALTRAVRVNDRVVRAWAAILRSVPGSRLVVNSHNYYSPATRADLARRFAAHGVAADRLELGYDTPPWDVLRRIDIGLDCFPHNSGTTLYEMLAMGVPFVTLAGRPSVGRLGASVLTALGHPEWIAGTEEAYVAKAVALGQDLDMLERLRAGLQAEMAASPLMDEEAFARSVESAYREMWRRC